MMKIHNYEQERGNCSSDEMLIIEMHCFLPESSGG
jgi:hypothetical protein